MAGEIGAQPFELGCVFKRRQVAVERNDVPAAESRL
jgi:hypothetical protein